MNIIVIVIIIIIIIIIVMDFYMAHYQKNVQRALHPTVSYDEKKKRTVVDCMLF